MKKLIIILMFLPLLGFGQLVKQYQIEPQDTLNIDVPAWEKFVWVHSADGGGATSNHALLLNLDYTNANHTGFAGTGVANTFSQDQSVPFHVYNDNWNNDPSVPTKNDVYDKIETIQESTMDYPPDGIAVSTGAAWAASIVDNSINWNEAYGWGNHALAGYITNETDPNIYNWARQTTKPVYTYSEVGAEAALGNPSTNGYVLSSTTTGSRSWIPNGSGSTMDYPPAGIPISTGSAWGESIINNSTNWTTAYNRSITLFQANRSGSTVTHTIYGNQQGEDWSASFTDQVDDADASISNEGVLGVTTGPKISSNTYNSVGVSLLAGAGLSVSNTNSTNGGSITFTNTNPTKATPGGVTNDVQYNNYNSFGGKADFSFDPVSNTLSVSNASIGTTGSTGYKLYVSGTSYFTRNVQVSSPYGFIAGTASYAPSHATINYSSATSSTTNNGTYQARSSDGHPVYVDGSGNSYDLSAGSTALIETQSNTDLLILLQNKIIELENRIEILENQ